LACYFSLAAVAADELYLAATLLLLV